MSLLDRTAGITGRNMGGYCRGLATILLTFGFAIAASAATSAPDELPALDVPAGGQRVLKLEKPIKRVAVGSAEIAEAKVLNDGVLLLQGNKPGETTLLLWTKGSVPSQAYRLQVNRSASVPPSLASDGLQLKSAGDLAILSGTSRDLQQHALGVEVAKRAGGDKGAAVDASTMAFGGEVQIEVRVVEFSRKVLKKAGINLWSNKAGFQFGTFAPGSLSKYEIARQPDNTHAISTEALIPVTQALNLVAGHSTNGWLGVLSLLEGNGFARTLAQPVLVAQSGQTADFLAGGEFPVPVPQALGQTTIHYKPFGIRLEVSPTVLAENRIALRVAPEVSDLNFENAITISGVSVPSLTTRRTSTSIELGDGESFVIGGLVSQSLMKSVDKIPGLGDIPVLGMFFKGASLSREDKELLFIVTPRLVRPLAQNAPLPPLPGADKADYNPSLWNMLFLSDHEEAAGFTGLSR